MALVKWLHDLPLPMLGGASVGTGVVSIQSTFSNGRSRNRTLSKSAHAPMIGTLQLSVYQNAMFEGFFTHLINAGSDWFLMDLPVAFGVEEHTVKFAQPPGPAQRVDADKIQRTIELIIRQPSIIEADLMVFLNDFGLADLEYAADLLEGMQL